MRFVVGVEAIDLIDEIPEFQQLMETATKCISSFERVYIYETLQEAENASNLLAEGGLYEEMHQLILLKNGKPRELFFDYGFLATEGLIFLYKDLLCAFTIHKGAPEQIRMALYQIEEHLVIQSRWENQSVFFVDVHNMDLITGIAAAYNIKVSFLPRQTTE